MHPPQATRGGQVAYVRSAVLVLDRELQDLEDGEFAELATIGIQSVEEGLAAVQETKSPLQTVSCTGSRRRSDSHGHASGMLWVIAR